MLRRDVLRSFALVPVAAAATLIPVFAKEDIQVPQNAKSFIERAKYLNYTELDFLQCKLVLHNEAGNKLQTRLFTKVALAKDPLKCIMKVDYHNPPVGMDIVSIQFMDKNRRCLFTPRRVHIPIVVARDEILQLTYTLFLS